MMLKYVVTLAFGNLMKMFGFINICKLLIWTQDMEDII